MAKKRSKSQSDFIEGLGESPPPPSLKIGGGKKPKPKKITRFGKNRGESPIQILNRLKEVLPAPSAGSTPTLSGQLHGELSEQSLAVFGAVINALPEGGQQRNPVAFDLVEDVLPWGWEFKERAIAEALAAGAPLEESAPLPGLPGRVATTHKPGFAPRSAAASPRGFISDEIVVPPPPEPPVQGEYYVVEIDKKTGQPHYREETKAEFKARQELHRILLANYEEIVDEIKRRLDLYDIRMRKQRREASNIRRLWNPYSEEAEPQKPKKGRKESAEDFAVRMRVYELEYEAWRRAQLHARLIDPVTGKVLELGSAPKADIAQEAARRGRKDAVTRKKRKRTGAAWALIRNGVFDSIYTKTGSGWKNPNKEDRSFPSIEDALDADTALRWEHIGFFKNIKKKPMFPLTYAVDLFALFKQGYLTARDVKFHWSWPNEARYAMWRVLRHYWPIIGDRPAWRGESGYLPDPSRGLEKIDRNRVAALAAKLSKQGRNISPETLQEVPELRQREGETTKQYLERVDAFEDRLLVLTDWLEGLYETGFETGEVDPADIRDDPESPFRSQYGGGTPGGWTQALPGTAMYHQPIFYVIDRWGGLGEGGTPQQNRVMSDVAVKRMELIAREMGPDGPDPYDVVAGFLAPERDDSFETFEEQFTSTDVDSPWVTWGAAGPLTVRKAFEAYRAAPGRYYVIMLRPQRRGDVDPSERFVNYANITVYGVVGGPRRGRSLQSFLLDSSRGIRHALTYNVYYSRIADILSEMRSLFEGVGMFQLLSGEIEPDDPGGFSTEMIVDAWQSKSARAFDEEMFGDTVLNRKSMINRLIMMFEPDVKRRKALRKIFKDEGLGDLPPEVFADAMLPHLNVVARAANRMVELFQQLANVYMEFFYDTQPDRAKRRLERVFEGDLEDEDEEVSADQLGLEDIAGDADAIADFLSYMEQAGPLEAAMEKVERQEELRRKAKQSHQITQIHPERIVPHEGVAPERRAEWLAEMAAILMELVEVGSTVSGARLRELHETFGQGAISSISVPKSKARANPEQVHWARVGAAFATTRLRGALLAWKVGQIVDKRKLRNGETLVGFFRRLHREVLPKLISSGILNNRAELTEKGYATLKRMPAAANDSISRYREVKQLVKLEAVMGSAATAVEQAEEQHHAAVIGSVRNALLEARENPAPLSRKAPTKVVWAVDRRTGKPDEVEVVEWRPALKIRVPTLGGKTVEKTVRPRVLFTEQYRDALYSQGRVKKTLDELREKLTAQLQQLYTGAAPGEQVEIGPIDPSEVVPIRRYTKFVDRLPDGTPMPVRPLRPQQWGLYHGDAPRLGPDAAFTMRNPRGQAIAHQRSKK